MNFRSGRMPDEFQHLRSNPIAHIEGVKVDVDCVVRFELANDFDFCVRWRRLAIDVSDQVSDAEAFRLRRSQDPHVVAI